ncbi:phosphatase PAP2 family protein [Erythrobacter sp. NE805]|uniref:phosphatase PAP2 family protein n=1 Tax=Erythrobacter sp. NE805 TaxID=3389875 RepID=UPI00396B1FEC
MPTTRFAVLFAAPLLIASQPASASSQDDWARASDIGVGGLLLWSIGVPLAEGDSKGALQAGAADVAGFAAAQALKEAFPETRPDRSGNDSFPSGHTATAFAAATSILERRGPGEGVPALALAGVVGLARVEADKHYWYDVVAGAAIGAGAGLLLTHPKADGKGRMAVLVPWGDAHSIGVNVAARF